MELKLVRQFDIIYIYNRFNRVSP